MSKATEVNLGQLAEELERQAERLAAEAEEARRRADAIAAKPRPEPMLDPQFADRLEETLAEPQQRLQRIAKSAR
jgi:hypothetical protein